MLRGGLVGARWIEPEDYHITLRFIGDVHKAAADEIIYELKRVRRSPLNIRIESLSAFGGNKPHSIIAKIRMSRELTEIQREHERIVRKIGLVPETRKFTPHVTLARLKKVKPVAVADYLSFGGILVSREFSANAFVVFSSRDSTGGGPYVIEAAYPLTPE